MSYSVVLLSFLGQILPISGAWFCCSTFRTRSQQRRARDAGQDIQKLSVVSPKNKFWCQDIDDRCVFWCYRNWIESQIYAVRCSRKFALQESTINKLRTLVIAIDHGVLSSALGYTHEEIIQICLCHWTYSLSISFAKLIALHRWLENMAGRLPKTWRTAHRWYFAGGLTFFSHHITHPSSSIGLCFYVNTVDGRNPAKHLWSVGRFCLSHHIKHFRGKDPSECEAVWVAQKFFCDGHGLFGGLIRIDKMCLYIVFWCFFNPWKPLEFNLNILDSWVYLVSLKIDQLSMLRIGRPWRLCTPRFESKHGIRPSC